MNLTELQIQLRSIEEQISNLQAQIEKMKPQPEDEKKAMFEKITELASKYPLESSRFPQISNVDVKAYISCLAYISLADDSKIYDKLLFLCRLSHGMGLPMSSEDIFRMGLEFDEKYFDKACSELKSQKYSFLADALILINITEAATETSFRLIADIAKIFECEKEDLYVAAMVAKAVLTDDFDILKQLSVSSGKYLGQFRQHIPVSWIKSQRVTCGKICVEIMKKVDSSKLPRSFFGGKRNSTVDTTSEEEYITLKNPCFITKILQSGSVVKKEDKLIVFEEELSPEEITTKSKSSNEMNFDLMLEQSFGKVIRKQNSFYSPCDGIVFFTEEEESDMSNNEMRKYVFVYVVSYFDDYAEFCDWHKKK